MADKDYKDLIAAIEGLKTSSENISDGDDEAAQERREGERRIANQRRKSLEARKKVIRSLKGLGSSVAKITGLTKILPGIVGGITGAISEGFQQFTKMETMGASFNKGLSDNFEASQKLADEIGGTEKLATAAETFGAQLVANNVGLNLNNRSLQTLYKSTIKTGEDFRGLSTGIRGVTAGFDAQQAGMDGLLHSLEGNTGALNMTRTQLVAAMQALSDNVLNMQGALGIGGLQEGMMNMSGLLKDNRLFGMLNKNMSELMGPGGLQKSIMLGVNQARTALVTQGGGAGAGQAQTANMLEAVFKGAARAKAMLGGAKGTAIGPEIMGALKEAGVLDESNIRLQEAILQEAQTLLGDLDVHNMSAKELAIAMSEKLEANKNQEAAFAKTIDSLKKEILMPFMEIGGKVAMLVKTFLVKNIDVIKKMAITVAGIIMKIISFISMIANWFMEDVVPNFKGIIAGITGILITIKAMQVGAMFGPWGMLIGGLVGAAAGAYAGTKVHSGLSKAEKSATGRMGDLEGIEELKRGFSDALGEGNDDDKKTAEATQALVEAEKKKETKGDMQDLIQNLDGFARFHVEQANMNAAATESLRAEVAIGNDINQRTADNTADTTNLLGEGEAAGTTDAAEAPVDLGTKVAAGRQMASRLRASASRNKSPRMKAEMNRRASRIESDMDILAGQGTE